ncbi:MAG TPA: STAS domain-containing protein [Spirochaetota bacterium]|nr:STAS domain-containing protein [Spirochaetota bacterium]HOM38296.1 STAS domain-containing protein [Spirochaetota bacterium]HPQ48486.1 STAS domain-containing protein [Spirochaetota bacterium]
MYNEKVIKIGYDEKGVYVDIKGEGTLKQSPQLKKFFVDVIDKFKGINDVNFIINMEECQYIDSTFIGLLLIVDKKLKEILGRPLKVLNPNNYAWEVLKQMGLENILTIERGEIKFPQDMQELKVDNINKIELAMMMYMSHSELANLNEENKKRFESAIEMLKKDIESEGYNINNNKI